MADKKDRIDEADSFWDIASLIPERRDKRMHRFSSAIAPAEVSISNDSGVGNGSSYVPFTEKRSQGETYSYIPDNSLVREVRVTRRNTGYDYHARFREDAATYLSESGEECRYVPFFSYCPQYSQMNIAQKKYYFYFRSQMREGKAAKCDEGYFFLFIYEIINLPDLIPPEEGLKLLCSAWSLCRKELPRIDKYMIQWIVDYCLISRLPAPVAMLSGFLKTVLVTTDFREFFLGSPDVASDSGKVDAVIAYASNYNWRASRYFSGEVGDAMKEHIPAVAANVLREAYENGSFFTLSKELEHFSRDAFCGALCSTEVRAHIEADYISLGDSPRLRDNMTYAVKYAENKVRAHFSVKSRLSVAGMDERLRARIDEYFSSVFVKPDGKKEPVPEYEKLYDAPSKGISLERAQLIEESSWVSTRMLVDEEDSEIFDTEFTESLQQTENERTEDESASDECDRAAERQEDASDEMGAEGDALDLFETEYLSLLADGDREAVRALLASSNVMEDTIAERINEKALSVVGDVVLEDGGGGYHIIDDYTEDVTEWIKRK